MFTQTRRLVDSLKTKSSHNANFETVGALRGPDGRLKVLLQCRGLLRLIR